MYATLMMHALIMCLNEVCHVWRYCGTNF